MVQSQFTKTAELTSVPLFLLLLPPPPPPPLPLPPPLFHQFRLPAHVQGGDTITVVAPTGERMEVTVPVGAGGGATIQVSY